MQALNAVGYSDAAQVDATPSVNASSRVVAPSTTTVLSTCTTATAQQPTCVQYQIPSGGGGVFGTQGGGAVTLPGGFCGGPCNTHTGAENSGALEGYDDPTKPLVEVVTWDSSTLSSDLALRPVCSTGSTATNCFPNNLPIFYEMSFTLLNYPLEASTELNLPGNTHFCSDPSLRAAPGTPCSPAPSPRAACRSSTATTTRPEAPASAASGS